MSARIATLSGAIALWGAALSCAPAFAEARNWVIDQNGSTLGVQYVVDDKAEDGSFEEFSGTATFDPDALEDADLTFDVVTESIDVGDPFGTTFVKSVDWFDVEAYPKATYVLDRLELIEGDKYRAFGMLTLRGATHPVEGEMTVTITETEARATGETTFDRTEFKVGIGFSALFVEIGPEVKVLFDLTARPAP